MTQLLDGHMFAVYGTTGMVEVPSVAENFRHFTPLVWGKWKGEECPALMSINRPMHLWYEEGDGIEIW